MKVAIVNRFMRLALSWSRFPERTSRPGKPIGTPRVLPRPALVNKNLATTEPA